MPFPLAKVASADLQGNPASLHALVQASYECLRATLAKLRLASGVGPP